MNTITRYVLVIALILFGLHYILSISNNGYSSATSIKNLFTYHRQNTDIPEEYYIPTNCAQSENQQTYLNGRRANAAIIMLARNSDMDNAVKSIREIEDRFNRNYHYPYVFLNEEPFSAEFKKRITIVTSGTVEFGLIPKEHWFQPSWIDEKKASASRKKMEDEGIIYGGSLPYRNMCRFNSGFFFKHPLLQKYKWYWRVEPDVHFMCDINYDPFLFMEDHNKTYGFTITLHEWGQTIPTLWGHVNDFIQKYPQHIARGNAREWMLEEDGHSFNGCHFWSNFEIADMDFWRGPAYQAFFEHLDSTGGFYYERWGDAPVHSIAMSLMVPKEQIHFFENIGYEHSPYNHCPSKEDQWLKGKCHCNPTNSFDYHQYSCLKFWDRIW